MLARVVWHIEVLHQGHHASVICHGSAITKEHKNHNKLYEFLCPLQCGAYYCLVHNVVKSNHEEEHFVLQVLAVKNYV
jgi:hypothetical protein